MPRRIRLLLIAASGALVMALAVIFSGMLDDSLSQLAARASSRIQAKAARASGLASQALHAGRQAIFERYRSAYSDEDIALYLFSNDSLVAWNNAQLSIDGRFAFPGDSGYAKMSFGHCYYLQKKQANQRVLALLLLKPEHELQNRYLSNDFAPWVGLPAGIGIEAKGEAVKAGGSTLFYVAGDEVDYSSRASDDWCFLLFYVAFLVILSTALLLLKDGAGLSAMGLTVSVVTLRLLMSWLHWPPFFYHSTLYDVHIFGDADSFFNGYLGDMLLNASLLLFAGACSRYLPAEGVLKKKRRVLLFWIVVDFLALFLAAAMINSSLASLVTNSTLSFNLLDFMNLSPAVLVGLLVLALLCVTVFLLLRTICGLLRPFSAHLLWLLLPLLIYGTVTFLMGAHRAEWAWLPVTGLIVYGCFISPRIGPATGLALFLIVMSAFVSAIMNRHMQIDEDRDLEVLTLKLGERQDPVLENEYAAIVPRAVHDKQVGNLVQLLPSSAEAIRDLFNSKYFGGYFRRYTIAFSVFDERCAPLLTPNDPLLLNEGYFIDQIWYHADSVATGLYFVRDYRRNARYIGVIPLNGHRLYMQLEPKQFEEPGSFPDLLLDESQQRHEKLSGFSYAVYRAGQNASNYGSLNYPPFLPDSAALARAEPDEVHRYFSLDDYTQVIISRPARTWAYFFTFNSYILLFFSIVGYVLFVSYSFIFTERFARSSLTRRIQTIIIVLLLLAMSAVGYTSASLVQSQFAAENKKELREKTGIIFTDLSRLFTPTQLFDPGNRDAVNTRLNEYSRLFNTDVSLFDANGFLYATSQPRLYALGLSARFAHPEAISRLSGNETAAVTISEEAGRLSYTSLYTALYERGTGSPAGYVNLPYFARQNDLVAELSGIVNGLVNVYVILFVVSIVAGLILAGYITRPLRLVQQQIARISLGGSNEKIDWHGTDELGKLIAEYNEMLVKLEQSAGMLARSERESAWREMAKQVAHEIKNPLTPMKLNLQYLQHLMKTDPADFREKFEKASAGIIEQIDSLATIANEFSHFAKFPAGQVETINIVEVIRAAVLLFENRQNITIRNRIPEEQIMVKGDRDQCLRVFNNVFTNAVQALQETHDPWIEIGRQMHPGKVVILVRDNGCGIDETLKDRIFMPNFTTKTTGSGLGLAMVKNIMEGLDGRVWFSSEKALGTIFYLEFSLA